MRQGHLLSGIGERERARLGLAPNGSHAAGRLYRPRASRYLLVYPHRQHYRVAPAGSRPPQSGADRRVECSARFPVLGHDLVPADAVWTDRDPVPTQLALGWNLRAGTTPAAFDGTRWRIPLHHA